MTFLLKKTFFLRIMFVENIWSILKVSIESTNYKVSSLQTVELLIGGCFFLKVVLIGIVLLKIMIGLQTHLTNVTQTKKFL